MLKWSDFKGVEPNILGKKKKFDNNIYSFDIETTSYIKLNGKVLPAIEYDKLSKDEQESCIKGSCMYIWMFSINEDVYYGRTWNDLKLFLMLLDETISERKIVFIHNLSYEFNFLRGEFELIDVLARDVRKPMKCKFADYNIELRCSYMMTNCKLERLPELYNLPVKKLVGNLDYYKLRTPITPLTDKELAYCENDCLVIYQYIKFELKSYDNVDRIPLTATGHVRRELKELTQKDYSYKAKVKKAINTDPHIYNLLIEAFAGGYTHANWIYADKLLSNVDSFDFTSSYPYTLVTHKFPAHKFKRCNIKNHSEFLKNYAYIIVARFKNLTSKYYNNFLSRSKCRWISKGVYDNGRVISCEECEIVLTEVDFNIILNSYHGSYTIEECYYSRKDYLPKPLINFILDKYVKKTQYKNVDGKELEYAIIKGMYNSIYGMSVTNTIKDDVMYNNNESGWTLRPLDNNEIEGLLEKDEKAAFLSFAYGVWVTAYARYNLISNIIKLDDYVVYCDTDSIKLVQGYDKKIINDYNDSVVKRIKKVCYDLDIDISKYAPKDVYGKEHLLGVFDDDGHYENFITQGAKKYAVTKYKPNKKVKPKDVVVSKDEDKSLVLEITVAGVPKSGARALKGDISKFRDDLVFEYKDTSKHIIQYIDDQLPQEVTDMNGDKYLVTDKTGACLLPTTYILGKALEYCDLISDNSSARAIYKE